jgi:hypothetical protein
VYQAFDIFTNEEVVVKSALDGPKAMVLKHEYHVLDQLDKSQNCVGLPKAIWIGRAGKLHVMVLQRLGPSLEEFLHTCGGRLSLNVVTIIAEQLVCFDVHTLI